MITLLLLSLNQVPAHANGDLHALQKCFADQHNTMVFFTRQLQRSNSLLEQRKERLGKSPLDSPPSAGQLVFPHAEIQKLQADVDEQITRLLTVWSDAEALKRLLKPKHQYSRTDLTSTAIHDAFYQLQTGAQSVSTLPMVSDCSFELKRYLGVPIVD